MAAMSSGTLCCVYAILKHIHNSRCRPRSLALCFVKLLAHLFQH